MKEVNFKMCYVIYHHLYFTIPTKLFCCLVRFKNSNWHSRTTVKLKANWYSPAVVVSNCILKKKDTCITLLVQNIEREIGSLCPDKLDWDCWHPKLFAKIRTIIIVWLLWWPHGMHPLCQVSDTAWMFCTLYRVTGIFQSPSEGACVMEGTAASQQASPWNCR